MTSKWGGPGTLASVSQVGGKGGSWEGKRRRWEDGGGRIECEGSRASKIEWKGGIDGRSAVLVRGRLGCGRNRVREGGASEGVAQVGGARVADDGGSGRENG